MRIYNVITQKGGTGKSETVKNLAYGLALKKLKVLIVDLDPQANTTSTLLKLNKTVTTKTLDDIKNDYDSLVTNGSTGREGIDIINKYMLKDYQESDVCDVLLNPNNIRNAIKHTTYENIDILPSSSRLIEVDMRLKASSMKVDTRLQMALEHIESDYDVCVIDNSPFINAVTINGISACKNEGDTIIIPIKIENGSLEGVDTTLQQLLEILNYSSFLAFDFKLLFTMRNRNKIEAEIEETLRHLFPNRCYEQTIRYQAKPVVTASLNKRILIEASDSPVANDYLKLVDEVYINYLSDKENGK